jgi:DASH complex subunit DAD2
MAYQQRTATLSSRIRPSSGFDNAGNSTQSSALQARINEKRTELENLRQLRDLSAGLAGQMQQLEEKLATLSDGTEAVAVVMGNWSHVLRAITMASGGCYSLTIELGIIVKTKSVVSETDVVYKRSRQSRSG